MELTIDKRWLATRNPWLREREIAEAMMLRGAILWSYGHIEQKITEIAIRCSYVAEYHALREAPPFTMANRITFLRRVLEEPGPLQRYRSVGGAILDRYDRARPLRNRMAHADMKMAGGPPLRFIEIVIDGGEIKQNDTPYYPGQLEALARRVGRFSRACQRLGFKLDHARLLPTFDEGRGDRPI
jgi:hypothetical protein